MKTKVVLFDAVGVLFPANTVVGDDLEKRFADARRSWLFSEYFDHIFLSFEIGYKKPAVQAYQAVTEYYKTTPGEIFFIDYNQKNVDAARQYGMQATTFTGTATLSEALAKNNILT